MDLAQMIAQARAAIAAKLEQRNAHATKLAELRSAETTDEQAVAAERAAKDALDIEIDVLRERALQLEAEKERDEAADRLAREIAPAAAAPKYGELARVISEPRTYTEHTARTEGHSFFADLYGAQTGRATSAQNDRLARHAAEVQVEREGGSNGRPTQRAMTTTAVGALVPPQYLVDQAAPIARAGRPTANLAQHQVLPSEGMSLVIPRGTTGASVAVQATQNSAASSTDQAWTDLTIPVATVAGQVDVSRQLLERGGMNVDQIIYNDLAGAHAVAVNVQVLSGSGTAGQVLGILSTAGILQQSAFAAAATIATFYTKVAGAINGVQTNRFLAPDVIVGHTRRWNWLASQLDAQNRPLVLPRANGPLNALGVWDSPLDPPNAEPQGDLQGLPFVTDASVPTAVGTGPEDQLLVARRADWILWEEGDGLPRELRFDQPLAGQLTVKLVAYSYIAFTAGRYPGATAVIGGNSAAGFGLIAPTF